MTREQESSLAMQRRIAATLIYEARQKDYEAACWLGLSSSIQEAAAHVHSAVDGLNDATLNQIRAIKAVHGTS